MWESILRFLQAENPDILATQETYNAVGKEWAPRMQSVELIKQAVGFSYASFAATRREQQDMGPVENGNAVFSRFPIIDGGSRFFDMPYDPQYVERPGNYLYVPRNMQRVVVDCEGTQLQVANVHGIWGEDGHDNERRLAMADTIIEEIQNKSPLILVGDFNMQEGIKSVQKIEKHVKSVFKGELKSTFNMRRKSKPGYTTAIVDMVFVTPDIQVISHYMPNIDVSDHMPLVVEVEI